MAGSSTWLEDGEQALRSLDWNGARAAFAAALAQKETPEALDGMARSLWWLGEPAEAMRLRERVFQATRRTDPRRAVLAAIWLAREFEVAGNLPAAQGWASVAERMLDRLDEGVEHGWLFLSRSAQSADAQEAEAFARAALDLALRFDDDDLHIRSLARLGLVLVTAGRVDEGMAALDEAMAASVATGDRAPETFGETCCDVILALEIVGDFQRLARWSEVIMTFLQDNAYEPLVAFCTTCSAQLFAAAGDVHGAERELVRALPLLEEKGQPCRCVHPAGKLAELRVLQGRFEEAERLLSDPPDDPGVMRAQIDLALARGEHRLAEALVRRALDRLPGESLLAVPYLARLARATAAMGDGAAAAAARDRLERLGRTTGDARARAEAKLASARVALLDARPEARPLLDDAIAGLDRGGQSLEAARARLLLAGVVIDAEPELAELEARSALRSFEAAGADREADQAAALLRSIAGTGRAGPKRYSGLTKRELEVLDLLGEGLTNAQIAQRLFISTKTAGHHVSNVLMKLQLKSRTEAAVYALRNAADAPATT